MKCDFVELFCNGASLNHCHIGHTGCGRYGGYHGNRYAGLVRDRASRKWQDSICAGCPDHIKYADDSGELPADMTIIDHDVQEQEGVSHGSSSQGYI